MFRKAGVAIFLFTGLVAMSGCGGGYYYAGVTVGPPAPMVEGPYGVMPGPGYVWTPGFYDWVGSSWVWRRGQWRVPPHHVDSWVTPRWEHYHNGYRRVGGGWQHGNGGHMHHY